VAGHGARVHEVEGAVDAHGADRRTPGSAAVELGDQLVVLTRAVEAELDDRREEGHHGERRSCAGLNVAEVAVGVGAQEAAVDRDHLTVEAVERPQPEVSVLGQLGKAEIAVEVTVEQRVQRRGLKDDLGLVPRTQLRPTDRLDVQSADQAIVDDVARTGAQRPARYLVARSG
jgi:hypothetical protein